MNACFSRSSWPPYARMMVAPVQRAAIHGATISLLLQSVTCAGGRDFDGLLLGRFQTHTETRFEDECSGRHAWHSPMHALQVVVDSRADPQGPALLQTPSWWSSIMRW